MPFQAPPRPQRPVEMPGMRRRGRSTFRMACMHASMHLCMHTSAHSERSPPSLFVAARGAIRKDSDLTLPGCSWSRSIRPPVRGWCSCRRGPGALPGSPPPAASAAPPSSHPRARPCALSPAPLVPPFQHRPPPPKNPGVRPFVHNACKQLDPRPPPLAQRSPNPRWPRGSNSPSLSLPPTHRPLLRWGAAQTTDSSSGGHCACAKSFPWKFFFARPLSWRFPTAHRFLFPLPVPASRRGWVKEGATQSVEGVLRPLAFLASRRRRMRGERFARDCIQTASDESLGYRDSDWRGGGRKKNVSHCLPIHLPIQI